MGADPARAQSARLGPLLRRSAAHSARVATARATYDALVDVRIAIKAGAVQALCVGLLFAALLAAPLPDGFFRTAGAIAGPLAWAACALVTGRLLGLSARTVTLAALAGGAAGAGLTFAGAHLGGMVAAIVVFALASGAAAGRPSWLLSRP